LNTPTPTQAIHTVCPACGHGHDAHREFGAYCALSCLTLGMNGQIAAVALSPDEVRTVTNRSKPYAH